MLAARGLLLHENDVQFRLFTVVRLSVDCEFGGTLEYLAASNAPRLQHWRAALR